MLIDIKILHHIQQTKSSELVTNFVVTNSFQHQVFLLLEIVKRRVPVGYFTEQSIKRVYNRQI